MVSLNSIRRLTSISLLVSQTKKITEFGRNGQVELAKELFKNMPKKNQITWNAMLSVLINAGHFDSALQLFDKMPERNATSYTSMIAGLSQSNSVSKARRLFDSIPISEHNVFSWSAMITCYVQNGQPIQALKLFASLYGDFFELRVVPNSHTFSILLKSCSSIRSLAAARQVHSLVVKLLDEHAENSVFVHNSLIDVNAKLGNLADAEGVFNGMKHKDLSTWNAMMDAYTHHLLVDEALAIFAFMKEKDALSWNIIMSGLLEIRRGEEALKLFLHLRRSEHDTKPNSSTYTIVLTSCVAMTMIEFGRQIHALIVRNGFFPSNTFVSNALITMYASCGLNKESEQVFDEMSNRDVVSWNSMIQGLGQNGCAQKALEIAEEALVSKNYNHNTFTAILTSCGHGGLVVEGLEYFNSMREKYGIEPSLDHCICVIDMLGRGGEVEAAHDLLRRVALESNAVAWSALLNACLYHGKREMGRIAAEKLQILEPGNARSYLVLATICNRTGDVEESRRLSEAIRKKEPGCSWVVERV